MYLHFIIYESFFIHYVITGTWNLNVKDFQLSASEIPVTFLKKNKNKNKILAVTCSDPQILDYFVILIYLTLLTQCTRRDFQELTETT